MSYKWHIVIKPETAETVLNAFLAKGWKIFAGHTIESYLQVFSVPNHGKIIVPCDDEPGVITGWDIVNAKIAGKALTIKTIPKYDGKYLPTLKIQGYDVRRVKGNIVEIGCHKVNKKTVREVAKLFKRIKELGFTFDNLQNRGDKITLTDIDELAVFVEKNK